MQLSYKLSVDTILNAVELKFKDLAKRFADLKNEIKCLYLSGNNNLRIADVCSLVNSYSDGAVNQYQNTANANNSATCSSTANGTLAVPVTQSSNIVPALQSNRTFVNTVDSNSRPIALLSPSHGPCPDKGYSVNLRSAASYPTTAALLASPRATGPVIAAVNIDSNANVAVSTATNANVAFNTAATNNIHSTSIIHPNLIPMENLSTQSIDISGAPLLRSPGGDKGNWTKVPHRNVKRRNNVIRGCNANSELDVIVKKRWVHVSSFNPEISEQSVIEYVAKQTGIAIKHLACNKLVKNGTDTVELSFDFPFYGHPVRNVTVATGGFLYTGDYVHSWLAATQYIAPLMANFDTSLSDESFVRIKDNGTAFTVIWEKVSLQDKQDVGKFTFSATLHKNGNIVFIYYYVPIDINAIQDDKHPVKVGLSDAYIIDKTVFYTRRKTIYEYHRINLSNTGISNATIIYLQALPTCLDYKDCAACSNHKTSFDCTWCPTLNRCSTGTDRKKQEWQQKGCDRTQIMDASACPPLGQRGNNASQESSNSSTSGSTNTTPTNVPSANNENDTQNITEKSANANETNSASITPVHNDTNVAKVVNEPLEAHAESKSMGLALGFLVPICLVLTMVLWVFYAYRNPHTKSGQLLIQSKHLHQYRPSQWSWRRGEARYTAATIHM
ncbi:plexin domain-containing protein 2-like [Rhagoletis pomonella]|uniref:plexin domain-containing protein 2-like n=1 Tax=Rhagoletis pomonella TaxID=28610 RepID=UPI00177A89AD|nr:plexin domain-containing protein 2-like [Rhagoletis pomonella]